MTDISKKFKAIIRHEELFKDNRIVMERLRELVNTKQSFKNITEDEIEALYIYLNRHNLPKS
jgi:hypothetical protein|tara:strand:- start:133 stop:318 length:186 start_codon:yes stop_codon:yes gene_type:complete